MGTVDRVSALDLHSLLNFFHYSLHSISSKITLSKRNINARSLRTSEGGKETEIKQENAELQSVSEKALGGLGRENHHPCLAS